MGKISWKSQGFTLIELLIVIGLFSILAAVATINLIRPQTKASVDASLTMLISDLKEQQIKAMVGDTEGQPTPFAYGIYFGSNSYTLFRGNTYNAGDSANFVVNLDTNINLTTTFPSQQIVFSKKSGEISGFVSGQNTVTVTNTADNEQKGMTLNQLGAESIQ